MEQTFGARLRSQREQQQVELAAIAEETKISVALLEGLERDDLSRWPGGLFRRAYVRTYAQKIGLNADQVVREFLAAYPDPVDETCPVEAIAQSSSTHKRPRTRIGFLIAGLAGLRPQRPDASRRLVTPQAAEPVVAGRAGRESQLSQPALADLSISNAVVSGGTLGDTVVSDPVITEPLVLERAAESHGPEPVTSELVAPEPAEAPRPARLVMVPAPDAVQEPRREIRTLERHLGTVARLCTRIACARDDRDLSAALEEAIDVLAAQGAILWVCDSDRETLSAALASGYSDELLSKLPDVSRRDDNAIAAAFRGGQKQIVRGVSGDTGALVVPLSTPDGCPGVLALEFANGGEQHELCQSLALIITAQFSSLFAFAPQGEREWEQPDRSLVAS
jgi:transcriptional regulator with XRE-family HTH domain